MVQNTPVLIIRHAVGYSNTDIKGKKRRNKIHGKSASETEWIMTMHFGHCENSRIFAKSFFHPSYFYFLFFLFSSTFSSSSFFIFVFFSFGLREDGGFSMLYTMSCFGMFLNGKFDFLFLCKLLMLLCLDLITLPVRAN